MRLQALGLLLRERRAAASLSRVALAAAAGVSQQTLRALEHGQRLPGRAALERLLAVPELGLPRGVVELMRRLAGAPRVAPTAPTAPPGPDAPPATDAPTLRWLVPAGCSGVQRVAEHARFLRGVGGHVEHSGAYLDHHSAHAFLRTLRVQTEAARHRAGFPRAAVARALLGATAAALHVIALGPGDGELEVGLLQALLQHDPPPAVELCLLDLSHPLLALAHQRAATGLPGVRACAVLGRFDALPSYPLPGREPGQRRVFLLLGLTLGSLDDERRLLGDNLAAVSERGDCLLVDCVVAPAGPVEPAALRRLDPLLADGLHPLQVEWLAGPLRRAVEGAKVELALSLDPAPEGPGGGHALDVVATVQAPDRTACRFVVFRFRRHDPGGLATAMAQSGWRLAARWDQLFSGPLRTAILLFQRR